DYFGGRVSPSRRDLVLHVEQVGDLFVETFRTISRLERLQFAHSCHSSRAALPGSVQGFIAERDAIQGDLISVGHGDVDGQPALALRFEGLARGRSGAALTPVFSPPDVVDMRTYDMQASPPRLPRADGQGAPDRRPRQYVDGSGRVAHQGLWAERSAFRFRRTFVRARAGRQRNPELDASRPRWSADPEDWRLR